MLHICTQRSLIFNGHDAKFLINAPPAHVRRDGLRKAYVIVGITHGGTARKQDIPQPDVIGD